MSKSSVTTNVQTECSWEYGDKFTINVEDPRKTVLKAKSGIVEVQNSLRCINIKADKIECPDVTSEETERKLRELERQVNSLSSLINDIYDKLSHQGGCSCECECTTRIPDGLDSSDALQLLRKYADQTCNPREGVLVLNRYAVTYYDFINFTDDEIEKIKIETGYFKSCVDKRYIYEFREKSDKYIDISLQKCVIENAEYYVVYTFDIHKDIFTLVSSLIWSQYRTLAHTFSDINDAISYVNSL